MLDAIHSNRCRTLLHYRSAALSACQNKKSHQSPNADGFLNNSLIFTFISFFAFFLAAFFFSNTFILKKVLTSLPISLDPSFFVPLLSSSRHYKNIRKERKRSELLTINSPACALVSRETYLDSRTTLHASRRAPQHQLCQGL